MFGLGKKKIHSSQASDDYWQAASSSLPSAWEFFTSNLNGLSDVKKLPLTHVADCLKRSGTPTQKFHTFRCAFFMLPIWNLFDQDVAINIRNISVLETVAEGEAQSTAAVLSFLETFNFLTATMQSDPVMSPVRFLVDSLCLNYDLSEGTKFDDYISAAPLGWIILQDPLSKFWIDYAKKYRVVF